jgi:hypothetical protein
MCRNSTPKQTLLLTLAGVLIALASPSVSRAQSSVAAGWDLFATVSPGTTLNGVQFQGVPLNTFDFTKGTLSDFGRGIGTRNVGNTDTIVKRLDAATVPSTPNTAPTRLEMEALDLRSVAPTDFGLGTDFYFITLQSDRVGGGTLSQGTMDITFNTPAGGTFNSSLNLFFDVRKGALNGPVAQSAGIVLTSSGNWGRIPPPNAVIINGVDRFLNGQDQSQDFWPVTPFTESSQNGAATDIVTTALDTPEPGTLSLLAGLSLSGSLFALKRRQK